MFTVLSGLLCSLSWATGDMFVQRATRETRALAQMLWVLVIGAAIIVPTALVVDGLPGPGEWRGAELAALAGALNAVSLFCLYRGLRVGDLGLISALVSLEGAYAAGAAVLLGAPMTPLLGVALALCACGAVLASFEGRARTTKGTAWAIGTGVSFACVMLCFAYGDIGWLSQTAISRSVSLVITLPVALLTGSVAVPSRFRPITAGAGVLELGGVTLMAATFALGPATVASVTTTQFGTFAVILGVVLLHERPKPNQWAGIACAIAGVSLLAAIT